MYRKLLALLPCLITILLTYVGLTIVDQYKVTRKETSKKERTIQIEDVFPKTEMPINNINNDMFLVFVGGVPRSGTTIMRTMMDAHPDMRCGQETHVIPEMLGQWKKWTTDQHTVSKLTDAGVLPLSLDKAVISFILEIIQHHGPDAKYLCNKDPVALQYTEYLHKLFPGAKFILMIRDGRASAHSIVSKNVIIKGIDNTNYRDVLSSWNYLISQMYRECIEVGPSICLPVYYEKLVLQPVSQTKRIFDFLGIPWSAEVLRHDEHINETQLSSFEHSTDQVKKPINLDGLTKWVGQIPRDVERDMPWIAPMLGMLGYNPYDPNPNYGEPDEFVQNKMMGKSNAKFFKNN